MYPLGFEPRLDGVGGRNVIQLHYEYVFSLVYLANIINFACYDDFSILLVSVAFCKRLQLSFPILSKKLFLIFRQLIASVHGNCIDIFAIKITARHFSRPAAVFAYSSSAWSNKRLYSSNTPSMISSSISNEKLSSPFSSKVTLNTKASSSSMPSNNSTGCKIA